MKKERGEGMIKTVSTIKANPVLTASGAIIGGTFYAELLQVLFDLRWAVLFIIVLVITDFWSGLTASVVVRKENFRLSRALRRTICKFLEYVNFIIFGLLLAKATLEPFGLGSDVMGGAIGVGAALLIEFDSIYGHVCDIHGIKKRFSVKRLFVAYLKRKNADVGEAVEEVMKDGDERKG